MRKHLQIIIEDYIYQAIQLSRHFYLGLNISFVIRLTFYTVFIKTHYSNRIIRVGRNKLFLKLIMLASGYGYTSYSKTSLVLELFSRCYTAISQKPYITQRKFQ